MREKRTALKSPDNLTNKHMRKLHLASFKFKVGDNELEETRLVASYGAHIDVVTTDAMLFWKRESKGTDRELLSCQVLNTLSEDEQTPDRNHTGVSLVKGANGKYFLFGDVSATGPMTTDELAEHLYEEMASGKLVMIQR